MRLTNYSRIIIIHKCIDFRRLVFYRVARLTLNLALLKKRN